MTRQWRRPLLAGALMLLAQLAPQFAHAQYAWIDDKGTRVFSDRPPPPGTPAARILKAPRAATQPAAAVPDATAANAPSPAAAPAASAVAAKAKPPSLAEQDAAFRQRQAKREEDARKAQEEAENKAAREERCALARQEELQMTQGTRITQVDAKGEKYFLSDEEKAKRAVTARKILQACR